MATHHLPRILLFTLTAILVWPSPAPAQRPAVLVNPHVQGNGTARTIQEGIGMVDSGGKVMVVPGTYDEAIEIDKGLTLEAVGGASGPVIIAPPGTPEVAIRVATSDPVVIRGLTVQYTGLTLGAGIRGEGLVDLTIEQTTVMAVNPPTGISALIVARTNDANVSGGRARLVVRHSVLDGTITDRPAPFPQIFGITVGSDVDAVLEGNVIRRTGGACVFVRMADNLGGVTNVEIVGNDLDECHPLGRAGSILLGPAAGFLPSTTHPVTATGHVNIVGNTIRNSSGSCLVTSAVVYEAFTGRIEHNRIVDVVPPCATPAPRGFPGAIWVGSLPARGFPPVSVSVRFNDITGNAQAGLRLGPNQDMTRPIDATCNWWGSASGPSGVGLGTGDAVVVEPGAATPDFTPWATAPIAETDETTCTGGN